MNINLLARLLYGIIKQAANAKNCWHSEFNIYAVGSIRPYSMFSYFAHVVENRGFNLDEVIDVYRRNYGNA